MSEQNGGSNASTPTGNNNGALPNPTATWPNLQETLQFERAATAIMNERPHTISTAYERGHHRPALTVYTFHAPEGCHSQPSSPTPPQGPGTPRPPIPQRCSSLERPSVPAKSGLALYSEPAEQHHDTCSTQPMYVNMHELANLAASKAQEMASFPPPPPEVTAELHTEKTEGPEKDGSTSESSLESSSGYGSQTMPNTADDTNSHIEEPGSELAANKYCTLPRTNDLRRRPLSTAGYPSGTLRNALLRRSSMQQQKPPPPIRRTSSISRGASSGLLPNSNNSSGSLEHLPPPPAFLLEGGATRGNSNLMADMQRNMASSIAAELQKRSAMGNVSDYQRTAALGIAAELQRKVTQYSDQGKPTEPIYAERKVIVKESESGISVAQTVRTLTELKHQPASPIMVRRTHSVRSQSCDRRVETGLIATLSAKLAPTLSPRHARRHSQETGFLGGNNRANRVRQWIAVRTVADPTICHDSLMDQIKRGTSLKKTRTVNDRSAPRIH